MIVLAGVVVLALAAGSLWSVLSGGHAVPRAPTGTAPPPSPGSPSPHGIDLRGWQLSIPIPNAKGRATTLNPAVVSAPWLTENPAGDLLFWAPTAGATTKHSEHPRTELDSLTNFTAGQGRHTLTASVDLLQVPQDGRGVILGQIHGAGEISSVPYVMLRFQDRAVRVVVKQVRDGDDHINYPLLARVGLNERWDFSITDSGDGKMTFSATQAGVSHHVVAPLPSAFRGATVRFQAGDYQQAKASRGAQDGGRVIFHQLRQ